MGHFDTSTSFSGTSCTYAQTYIVRATEETTYDILIVVDSPGSMGTGEYRVIDFTNQQGGFLNSICEGFETWNAHALYLENH